MQQAKHFLVWVWFQDVSTVPLPHLGSSPLVILGFLDTPYPPPALIKDSRPGGPNNRIYSFMILEAKSPKPRCDRADILGSL